MPKWKKDAKEFTVSVNYNDSRGYQSSIPKPVMVALGEPTTVTFVINGNNVKVEAADQTDQTHTKIRIESSNKRKKVK